MLKPRESKLQNDQNNPKKHDVSICFSGVYAQSISREEKGARQCIHQSRLLNCMELLSAAGVRVFRGKKNETIENDRKWNADQIRTICFCTRNCLKSLRY